jgi:glycosyltransferase involved in cell wall biosynthesis
MYASDVDLGRGIASDEKIEARAERLRRLRSSAEPPALCLRLGFLGSFAQLSKGPDVLLRAAAACLKDKLDCEVVLAGEGKFRQTLERLASDLGIMDRVRFLGSLLPGDAVRDFLDQVDLFVLPSRTEGLPRALVEAMARGCPAIGSNVGGIPELLLPEDLVVRDDPRSLAGKIHEVCADPERMIRMSRRNWEGAKGYVPEVVQTRRLEFYRRIRDLAAHAGPDQAAGGGT